LVKYVLMKLLKKQYIPINNYPILLCFQF
jgi:hypothetical protein